VIRDMIGRICCQFRSPRRYLLPAEKNAAISR
jgi:hypothetical protein